MKIALGLGVVFALALYLRPSISFVPDLQTGEVVLLAKQPLHRNFPIRLRWAQDTKTGKRGWCYFDEYEHTCTLAFQSWDGPDYQSVANAAMDSLPWFWQNFPPPKK